MENWSLEYIGGETLTEVKIQSYISTDRKQQKLGNRKKEK